MTTTKAETKDYDDEELYIGKPIDEDYLQKNIPEQPTVSVRYSHDVAEKNNEDLDYEATDGAAAYIDEKCQTHTTSGEDSFIGSTNFYAREGTGSTNWDRLWMLHSGNDNYSNGHEEKNSRLKVDRNRRFRRYRAEVLCNQSDLNSLQQKRVINVVKRGGFNRLTYVGTIEVVVVGIIANVVGLDHPAVEKAAEIVGVEEIEYVAEQVDDKLDIVKP